MIPSVSVWLKDIIFVVLFATFMELLLPSSSMQRFIRVIMGLFIMLTILNPVLNFIEKYMNTGQELSTVVTTINTATNGNVTPSMVSEREQLSYELYKKELARQIQAVVTTVEGVADAVVAVEVNSTENGKLAGSIKNIIIYVKPGIAAVGRKITPVSKVNIGENKSSPETPELRPQLISKVQHAVSELYQLPKSQIDVKLLY